MTSNRTWAATIALAAVVFLAGGCANKQRATSGWMKSVNSIKSGATMERVRDKLGAPDEKRRGDTPVRPYPPVGSPEGVLGTLPPDTKFEQWLYNRGDSVYHVFFARTRLEPRRWEVIAVRSAPEAAVN